ncbi:MAG: ATP-binding protein [Candidatus Omnitrophota bacterium]
MKEDFKNQKTMSGIAEYIQDQKKLLYTSFEIRVLNILVAFVCLAVLKNFLGIHLPDRVLMVFGIWLLTSVFYLGVFRLINFRKIRSLENAHCSYYFFGVIYATGVAHYIGGAEWISFFIYLVDLVYANVLLRRGKGMLVTAFIVFSFLTLIYLEYKGIISHHRQFVLELASYDSLRYILCTNVVVVTTVFVLLSYSTGLFSKMKEDRENRIIDSRNTFEVKTRQLENIARELKKKVAENKYIKRAAMGYIEKKEFELAQVKKDLEDQISKLRKTQKSMFFMIEDLNEMSSQLKEARDHLEDKVRERTEDLLDISGKLHRSERLAFLGKLSGSVTHELRNPLAVLKNAVYFLEKRFKDENDEKVARYIDIVRKEINIIDSIIDDIMGFAKTRAPELEETDIRDVIDAAVSSINIPEMIKVKKEFNEIPVIKIDKEQVLHAVVNIANNAIMAMNGNGVLTFRASVEDNKACIEIQDTGPGIPPDEKGLIFEPLYSSKPKGTGLGLPIARMMVENNDGTIEFDTELGEGTIFRILLPLYRRESA